MAAISIETGRILDVEVRTRYCQGCINIEKFKENADLYEHLKLDHVCNSPAAKPLYLGQPLHARSMFFCSFS